MKRKRLIMILAAAVCVILSSIRVHAQTFKTLYAFTGSTDGGLPGGGLIFDAQGNLYGVTQGIHTNLTSFGTVFELSPSSGGGWTLTTLYTFQGGTDGESPTGSLVFDTAGNLYGTTTYGANSCYQLGCGTVFELSPNGKGGWQKTEIYRFLGNSDGANPLYGVVIDGAGNLYGTTLNGGGLRSLGTVFELSPVAGGWTEKVLHGFGTGRVNGAGFDTPGGGVVLDAKGNLYGTASFGGPSGCGGIFELSPGTAGWSLKVLHGFKCGSDGAYPQGTPAFDSMGRIYGMNYAEGAFNDGTVFILKPGSGKGWGSRVIHNFDGNDGWSPQVGVTLDVAGNVYGTTQIGGGSQNCTDGCGVAYRLLARSSSSWTYSLLHIFTLSDGRFPNSLVLDGAGNLFGTTVLGGADSLGTVFEITPN